ncbi:hypothetical protein D9758_006322 [Tetrapyrgos nigripes]|uniref:Uncharacterized protein n=1 Tax=Tetrapyrgos nigripes TaxID=182062 RepID=A0A8H5D961_9AGAR|nr:hypothetical protein D9758_006322 [Tetrapyrgos nigripes]
MSFLELWKQDPEPVTSRLKSLTGVLDPISDRTCFSTTIGKTNLPRISLSRSSDSTSSWAVPLVCYCQGGLRVSKSLEKLSWTNVLPAFDLQRRSSFEQADCAACCLLPDLKMSAIVKAWRSYTPMERRNIALYIGGIMCYKMGLEFFNGSITALATDRFNEENTFTKLGAAQGLNQAAQCVGAILIAPMIKRWPTRTVLSGAIVFFAFMTVILLIVDAATGGEMKLNTPDKKVDYGDWDPDAIFVIWTLAGIAYGMVELIRRVIPCDIVGGEVNKLRRMDATVHVFYEVAGTAGAFASSSAIQRFGNNYSFFLTPIFFTFAGGIWITLSRGTTGPKNEAKLGEIEKKRFGPMNYVYQLWSGVVGFVQSVWVGFLIVFGHRSFIWLFPGYALALYLHRFLESSLAPAYARRVLGTSAWSQIIVGGSNFGELLGALAVFFLSDIVTTPIPWLRFDALALNIVWVLPYFSTIATQNVGWAWRAAGCFIPISMGWAAGDVSLAAYIQASLSEGSYSEQFPDVSPLGAVMAFLYSTYIVLNAINSSVLGRVIDRDWTQHRSIESSLRRVGGIQFSICSGIILLATLVPRGALALNPKRLEKSKSGLEQKEEEDLKKGASASSADSIEKEVV